MLRGLLVAGALACVPAAAQEFFSGGSGEGRFDITADSVELDPDGEVYVARGNVRVEQPGRILTSDWMTYSNLTQQGIASGNVVVIEGGDSLFADVLHFETDDFEGLVLRGRLEGGDNEFIVTGDTIRKTGELEYVFDEATFTTCRCPPGEKDPWMITAETADLEFGGYATTRNTSFDVLGVPVLWSPWMRYPLKSGRETGVLFPLFGASERSGFDLGLPFFWAARKNINVLFTPHYLTDNGFKPSLEVEYVFGEFSYGSIYGSYLHDDDAIDSNDPSTPFGPERWAVEWIHDQHLPEGWRLKVDGRILSDNSYAFDFVDMDRFRNDRYIESRAFVDNHFGNLDQNGLVASIVYADDIQNPDDQDRDDFLINRMPDVVFSGVPEEIPGLPGRASWSFDTRYTHFWAQDDVQDVYSDVDPNEEGFFADIGIEAIPDGYERNAQGTIVRLDGSAELSDGTVLSAAEVAMATDAMGIPLSTDGSGDNAPGGPEGDGLFEEGEPVADRGHRFVLNPRLHLPFHIGDSIETMAEVGYHGTFYDTDNESAEVRNLLTASLDLRSRLRKSFELPFGAGQGVHLMEPRVTWTGILDQDQDDNPLFIPRPRVLQRRIRQFEPTAVTRDPSDRIEDVNAFGLGLGNRIYIPGEVGPDGLPGSPRLYADVGFSLYRDFGESDIQSFFMEGLVYPTDDLTTRAIFGWNFEESEISESLLEFRYGDDRGNDLAMSYRLVRDVPRFFENFQFDDERFDEFEEGLVEINQIDLRVRWAATRNFALTYRMRYSFEQSLDLGYEVGAEYMSKCACWAVRLEVDQDRTRGTQIGFEYVVVGLGDDTVRPFAGQRGGQFASQRDDR